MRKALSSVFAAYVIAGVAAAPVLPLAEWPAWIPPEVSLSILFEYTHQMVGPDGQLSTIDFRREFMGMFRASGYVAAEYRSNHFVGLDALTTGQHLSIANEILLVDKPQMMRGYLGNRLCGQEMFEAEMLRALLYGTETRMAVAENSHAVGRSEEPQAGAEDGRDLQPSAVTNHITGALAGRLLGRPFDVVCEYGALMTVRGGGRMPKQIVLRIGEASERMTWQIMAAERRDWDGGISVRPKEVAVMLPDPMPSPSARIALDLRDGIHCYRMDEVGLVRPCTVVEALTLGPISGGSGLTSAWPRWAGMVAAGMAVVAAVCFWRKRLREARARKAE
jgi:hypothetical protein